MCKPFKKDELLNLAEKLISKENIFGLEHYIDGVVETKKIRINSSRQIKKAIAVVCNEILAWGFKIENRTMLNLILNEMVINAVYHSHGLTEQKNNGYLSRSVKAIRRYLFERSGNKYGTPSMITGESCQR